MVTNPSLAFSKGLRHKAGMVERGKSAQQRLREFQGQLRKMLPLVERLLEAGEVQERAGAYTAQTASQDPLLLCARKPTVCRGTNTWPCMRYNAR